MGELTDRVAIVTGAGGGIGAGVARAFARAGATVVVANRTESSGTEVTGAIERDFRAIGARAIYIQTDVSHRDSVRNLVDETIRQLGRVDIVCNNATPPGHLTRLENLSDDVMHEFLAVNHYGPMWAMQAAFPHMKAQQWGRIITMCSLNGVNAHRYTAMYNSSKEAIRALTRTAAVEWGQYGITCNAICPAAVTPPWQAFEKFDPKGAQEVLDANPMRRMGDAEADIGPLAVFLASDAARYITGNTIHADGGGHISGVPWNFEPLE